MMNYWSSKNYYYGDSGFGFFKFLIPLMLLDLVLRGIALWRSAKKDQGVWFIALLIVNSMGILPLIYLLLNREVKVASKKVSKRK